MAARRTPLMWSLIWSRYLPLNLSVLGLAAFTFLGVTRHPDYFWALVLFVPLCVVALGDLIQPGHAILRNYPLIGHLRFILESFRPEIRQYLIEDDRDPVPFSREQRALVYRRAKNVLDKQPFGTMLDVDAPGYAWMAHSIKAIDLEENDFRISIGGPACRRPYSSSILNISGTSFGAVSSNAVQALNLGAKIGGFAHNTGEGSVSVHHRKFGGDLIWQIATGYFGCRAPDGRFDPEAFKRQAADPQVKMIEIKLSQGAKPGHGGVLPKAKITKEIALARGIGRDGDCVSPPSHSEFSTPLEFCAFIDRLRTLADGKPIGVKLCVGHRFEFLALIKAMLQTGVTPDFIVVDGKEGGTGAAPSELTNHVGLPLTEGLTFVNDALVGAGLKNAIKLGASGKIITAFDICRAFALGADFIMSARGFMFSLGCIQARNCHSNACPSGVATQNFWRRRALVVSDKSKRVASFHKNTMKAVAQVLGAAGLSHPQQIKPMHLHFRHETGQVIRGDEAYGKIAPGALLVDDADGALGREWRRARAESFDPVEI
jgi:glutamate synthase domain-containing protein 2